MATRKKKLTTEPVSQKQASIDEQVEVAVLRDMEFSPGSYDPTDPDYNPWRERSIRSNALRRATGQPHGGYVPK